MTITSEITRIKGNIAEAYTALSDKGATLPVTQNSANLANTVASIPAGGSGSGDKYKVGDRVNDDSDNPVGTVSSIFTDGNGDRYAVVCLDAVNRLASGTWCSDNTTIVTDLPTYNKEQWGPWEAKETATYNTQKILDFCAANNYTSEACSHCRSKSFTIDGTTYYGQLPNLIELYDIVRNHTALNNADPTASSYSSVNFSTGLSWWSSSQYSSNNAWSTGMMGDMIGSIKNKKSNVVPVLEIPLEE